MKREIIDASQLELVDQVVDIKRVTKVVKGGRNMRFTALVVVGDKNGHVGAGLGKAAEIPEAIRKGKEDAIKSLISVKLDENNSITHDVTGKYTGASVLLKKSPEGTGIIAGGPARSVCELSLIHISSKVAENKFVVVDELKLDEIKTKKFVQVMDNLKVEKALVVLNDMDTNVIASAANIPTVKTAQTNELNVFDALKYDKVVVTKAALATIEEVYA